MITPHAASQYSAVRSWDVWDVFFHLDVNSLYHYCLSTVYSDVIVAAIYVPSAYNATWTFHHVGTVSSTYFALYPFSYLFFIISSYRRSPQKRRKLDLRQRVFGFVKVLSAIYMLTFAQECLPMKNISLSLSIQLMPLIALCFIVAQTRSGCVTLF